MDEQSEQLIPATKTELAETIAYALENKMRRAVGSRQAALLADDCRIVAKAIADHLELCGFRPMRKPPLEPHGGRFPGFEGH